MLERIGRINDLKDDHSLDDIAEMLSPDLVRKTYPVAEVAETDWLAKSALDLFDRVRGNDGEYGFSEVVFVAAIDQLAKDAKLSSEQLELAVRGLVGNFGSLGNDQGRRLTVASRSSVSYSVVHSGTCHFDPDADVVATVDLDSVLERVKLKLDGTV